MVSSFDNLGKLGIVTTITVTAKAESLSLTIPKELCETFDIIAGDRLVVHLKDHYRPKPDQ